jgi:hypothetical protein
VGLFLFTPSSLHKFRFTPHPWRILIGGFCVHYSCASFVEKVVLESWALWDYD